MTSQPYPGADYYLPNNVEKFKQAMLDIKAGRFDTIQKYKRDINEKIEWYGGKFCPEQSLLSIACQNGHNNIVKWLINKEFTMLTFCSLTYVEGRLITSLFW